MKKRLVVVATIFSLLAVGCAPAASPTADPSSGTQLPPATDLATMRTEAGIPDCPEPAEREPVTGGLPDVTLDCLGSDRSLNLTALPPGPAIINVWAQWCPPCRQEAPALASFARSADGQVAVYGVDFGDPNPELAIEFAALAGWPYPHLVDPRRELTTALGVTGIPTTVFVAEDGTVAYIHVGPFANEQHIVSLAEKHLGVRV